MAERQPTKTELLTLRGAEREIGIPRGQLRAAIDRGEVEAFRLGDRWLRVSRASVWAYVRRHRVAPTRTAEEIAADLIRRENGED